MPPRGFGLEFARPSGIVAGMTASLDPDNWRGKPLALGPWRGRCYPGAAAILPEPLRGWCEALAAGRTPAHDRELKPNSVWACGTIVLKRYPPGSKRNAALRAADRFRRCLPVPSPRPLAALEHADAGGLLASERIKGHPLSEVWERDPAARAAFPAFMALMHRHRVYHGDLHSGNAMWDGRRWVLIDLDGLRSWRYGLLPGRQIRRQWGQFFAFRGFPEAMPNLFAAYAELLPLRRDPAKEWAAIAAYARRLPAHWEAKRARQNEGKAG